MPMPLTPDALEVALRDLRTRTLAALDGDFARLVYLASTRNYNTGRYEHDGLSFRFPQPIVEQALAIAHREIFAGLALSSLRTLVDQLEQYVFSGNAQASEVLATWRDLEAYRVLPPAQDDPLTVALFLSNVNLALAIVEPTWKIRSNPQSAWQPPSPDRRPQLR